ncbi:MAG: S8 family serine peptidase, partial [Natronomonas sp.]
MSDDGIHRRTFVKGIGIAAGTAAFAGTGVANSGVSTAVLDEQFDLDGGLQEALVVFDSTDDAERLETLDLEEGYRLFEHLDIAWTHLRPAQIETVAGWDSVRRVKRSEQLEWHNDDTSRESMAVDAVHEDLGYTGEDAHVVVIDSGLNASHPGIGSERVEANFRYVDEPTGPRDPLWVDAGPGDTDTVGHGQHCAGIVAGNGEGGVNGTYEGMAPDATITSYAVVQGVYLPYVVAAWDHLLGRIRTEPEFDPDVVSNSYGVSRNNAYNPNDPVNVATWEVFNEGVLPVFSYGNDGPDLGSGNRFAKAPHVLGVGAAEKTISPEDNANNRSITNFSSRGREVDDDTFYNREQLLRNLRQFHAIQSGAHATVDSGTFTGTVGPGVNTSPGAAAVDEDTGSAYERLQTFGNVDLVDLTLTLDPEGQWVRMRVHEEQNGEWVEIAQSREEPLKQHDTLTVDVDGGNTYLVELEPEDAVAADYTIEYEQYEKADGDLSEARPLTLFRPGISAHGNLVLSTQDKADVLGPLGETGDAEPFYGRLSGTSMSCPGAAGIAMLVQEAYRAESGGDELSPIDLIRVLEHSAADFNPDYTVTSTGAGFVDAEAADEAAEALDDDLEIGDLETGLDALVEDVEAVEPPET